MKLQPRGFLKSINKLVELIRHKDFYGTGVFLLLVMLIGYQELISPAIGVFVLVVLVEAIFLRSLRFVFNPLMALFIGLYLFYLAGLLWAEHQEIGWKLLEYKMSFFIFPILFFFQKKNQLLHHTLNGLVCGALILAARFFYEKYTPGGSLTFYDISRVELNLHPTYASIYFALAIVFLCLNLTRKRTALYWIFAIASIILFTCMIFATASLSGILFLGLLAATGAGVLVRRYLKKTGLVIYLVLLPLLVYLVLPRIPSLAYDMEVLGQMKTEIREGKDAFIEKNKTTDSGNRERVLLWFISAEIIAENPFGVGTGDIDYYLQAKCDQHGLQLLKQQNLNPHNQYLQIGIDLGIPGIIYLLFCLTCFLIKGIRTVNWFLIIAVASLLFNALFESVLQRQSGIVFYTLLICLLLAITAEPRNQPDTKQL